MIDRPKAESLKGSLDKSALARVAGRRVGVIGMARSGIAAATLAHELGADVFVTDMGSQRSLGSAIDSLKKSGIECETGAHSDKLLHVDYVIVSPGVPSQSDILQQLHEAGTPVFSELEFASWFTLGKIIGVTGANGKTTTVTMIHYILQAANYTSRLCGNIGTPLSAVAPELGRDDVAVVEVSSYQLEHVEQFAPDVAAILNITPDHLSRHGSFEIYRAAKLRITEAQEKDGALALNIDDTGLDALSVHSAARRIVFGSEHTMNEAAVDAEMRGVFMRGESLYCQFDGALIKLLDCNQLQVPGRHNVENAMAAATCALAFGIPLESIREGLLSFPGVEHRIEHVATINGVQWINDSKATNLAATICALEALDSPALLILGGRGKGEDFKKLQDVLTGKVRNVVAIGETKEEIFASLGKTVAVELANSLEEATQRSFETARPGEVVLLSPGCASFDMFENFEERGTEFKNAVMRLENSGRGV